MINFVKIYTNLKYTINKSLNDFNDIIFKRDRLLDFNSVFLFICKYNSSINNSYNSSISSLIIDNVIPNISKTAFIIKLSLIDHTYFLKINNIIIDYFYNIVSKNNTAKKYRFIAIDGSQINFKKSLQNHFKLSKNKNYSYATLSCLFDIELNFPINYLLSNSFDERKLLIEQLPYINTKDVIIADRGYFSFNIIHDFLDKNINFIFRINKKNKFISNIKKNELSSIFNYIYNNKIYKLKIYKYNPFDINKNDNKINKPLIINIEKIKKNINTNKKLINKLEKKIIIFDQHNAILLNQKNNINIDIDLNLKIKKSKIATINLQIKKNKNDKDLILINLNKLKKLNILNFNQINENNKENDSYYILTSCYKLENNELKDIYIKRWCIETNFKFLKSNFKFDKLNSVKINTIKQNLYACQFLFIIESLINYITPNELINIDKKSIIKTNINLKNIINNKSLQKKVNINVNKNDIVNKDNKILKKTNKSVSFNIIGNHLLKNFVITKIKKKDKKILYKKKIKKNTTDLIENNELFLIIVKKVLTNTLIIFNEIIKNKIALNDKKKIYNKRINKRPNKKLWF